MSCGIIFLSDNLVENSIVSLTTGTENIQFPLENIKNEASAVKFRSQENSVVILFDLQQTREIDTIALHGDTNADLGLTDASIRTSLTTDFSGSTPVSINLSAEHLLGYSLIPLVSHRYVELTLTGTGSYAELSNVFIGKRTELLQQNLSVASFSYGYIDNSNASVNDYGQYFVNKRPLNKILSGDIEFCLKSEQDELEEIFKRHGTNSPLWIIVDQGGDSLLSGEYKLTLYGYLNSFPNWSASGGQHYNTSISLKQAG